MAKTIRNIDVIKSIRKPLAPARRVELDKFTKAKRDVVQRKAKHKTQD
jgi:hypothetical protein